MTVRELIKALGGPHAVAGTLCTTPQAVSNWYARGVPAQHRMNLWRLAADAGLEWRPDGFEGVSLGEAA